MATNHRKPITSAAVWAAIDALGAKRGYSPSGLAKACDLDTTAFNPSKRLRPTGEPRWPNMSTVAAVCRITGSSLKEFAGLVEGNGNGRKESQP